MYKKTVQDLLVTLLGAITSLLTAVVLSWIERRFNFSIYSFMVWFVLPLGAMGAGFVAAGGYYLGAILFNHKPQKMILLNMVAISLGTYFLIHYLNYSFLKIDGVKISNLIPFEQYWTLATSHSAIRIGVGRAHMAEGNPVELGSWGYVYAALQIIGFAFGGLSIYANLASKLYCGKCSRYLSTKGTTTRYTVDREQLLGFLAKMAPLLDECKLSEAITLHATEGGEVNNTTRKCNLRTDVKLQFCKDCGQHHLLFDILKLNRHGGWDRIQDFSLVRVSNTELSLPE